MLSAVPAVPVITIDGPTASGKGTIAARVAEALGWHLLDSGALYRLTALKAMGSGVLLDDEAGLAQCAAQLRPQFIGEAVFLEGAEVTLAIRAEPVGQAAPEWRYTPNCALLCCSSRGILPSLLAWSPTVVTWARWCSPKLR
jgi:CMP/dCMP kinase